MKSLISLIAAIITITALVGCTAGITGTPVPPGKLPFDSPLSLSPNPSPGFSGSPSTTVNSTILTAEPSSPSPSPTLITPIQATESTATVNEIKYCASGYTNFGEWYSELAVSPDNWQPGSDLRVTATLEITQLYLTLLAFAGMNVDGFLLLITAERTFDANGVLRLGDDEKMSTLLTPTGLGIEGGIQGAVTNRFGYGFRTPVDELVKIPLSSAQKTESGYLVNFTVQTKLPADLPPGIYRIRADYGITSKTRYMSLNNETFARRPFFQGRAPESHLYSPPIRASGIAVTGSKVDAASIRPRIPWVILNNYNSNGYRGVVADEDQPNFAISNRTIIQDDVILPLYDTSGKVILAYNLEPQFLTDTIELRNNIPWDFTRGELAIQVTGPDNKTTDLGIAPFIGNAGQFPTTKKSAFTAWKPSAYGYYTVKVSGWTADIWGNRYEGGGTYHFWIAKRMTLATATFQGFSYPVGNRYGRDIAFAPAVPADVEVTAYLFVNSDPKNVRTVTSSGKASPGGIFGTAQGLKPLPFDAAGEYSAHILAKYTEKDGTLWVESMRHAGVVYPDDSPIVAHGKKITAEGKILDRGQTNFEGYIEALTDISHLAHINFPYLAGDVLLIASDGEGANKIEPVLTYETKAKPEPYDTKLQTIGTTNIKLMTSNGYSPHLFPEYITDWQYYYAGAPRPGFMSRFLVGEDGVRAPYWPTSPNSFGGQINASSNGDLPGDIYRLIGGVVIRNQGQTPVYAGYLSSAFILPHGTNNNRVIAAGSENVIGSDGSEARFFLTGTRPGMTYEVGSSFTPAVQVDPVLPAVITFTLTYPDGRRMSTSGTADVFGSWAGGVKWVLDIPGVYTFNLQGTWQGFTGKMPGLPPEGGEIYVIETNKPAGAAGLKVNLPAQSTFDLAKGLTISGTTTGQNIHYAAVIPGAVIAQGTIPVQAGGKFSYFFDPTAINRLFPTYDIVNIVNGKMEIKDVVHFTLFSEEKAPDGTVYHTFTRLIFRGTTVLYTQ